MRTKRQLHERSPPGLDIVPESQRRKLSFPNSDLSDLGRLEPLYERCLDQVLRGLHPVSRDTAIKLAAVQCYVQFGPYRKGIEDSIRAYNLLPKEYVHAREHEKNIAEHYRNLLFPDGVAAKRKYCEICKNLPTYGMIFFEVREPHGSKMVARLFGVNKDCVMSVDKKSKVVRKSWPLEQLRRWAASPWTFNIDFGDYQEGYYSVQTQEGEKIKRLIAEFVDIILKKKQIVDPFGLEGDEGAIMIEDYVLRGRSVPLSMDDVHKRLESPLGEVPELVDGFKQPPASQRSPFMPLENQQQPFPAETAWKRPFLPAEQQPPLADSPFPPLNAAARPGIMPSPAGQQQVPMPKPRQLPVRQPALVEHYDQLPFQLHSPIPQAEEAGTLYAPFPHQPQPMMPSPTSHYVVPSPQAQFLPPPATVPLPQLPVPPASVPPPAAPQGTQSLPPSLVNSMHQDHQQLVTTSSSSIAQFTSHDIAYEIVYKDGLAQRSFQQHFQSSRNLQAFGTAVDQAIRRLTETRTVLARPVAHLTALDQSEREAAIQVGQETIRHRAVVFLASAAQGIEWTSEYQHSGPKFGHAQVAITQAGDNLCEMVQCVSEISALVANAPFTAQLYALVNSLCDAFTSFLSKLHPDRVEKRSAFLSSASLVGECAFALLNALNSEAEAEEDQFFYLALNEAIQAVANGTANLVQQAKAIPAGGMSGGDSTAANERVIQSATQVALFTSELIALARVLAAIMAHPACQKRVQGAVERVRLATVGLLAQAKENAFSQFTLTGSAEHYAQMQRNALAAELALQQLSQQIQA